MNIQGKLYQTHLEWVEFLQSYTFGFNELKNLYSEDPHVPKAWKSCKEPVMMDRTKWLDFITQDDMLFRGSHLCIPRSYMRVNFIKEKHSGRLVRIFDGYKTIALVGKYYYWPEL